MKHFSALLYIARQMQVLINTTQKSSKPLHSGSPPKVVSIFFKYQHILFFLLGLKCFINILVLIGMN